jgi:Ca2+-binding EF-hand superfamily protein
MEAEWTKVFDLHDVDRKKTLPKSEVAHVIRSCGRLLLPSKMDALLAPFPAAMSRDDFVAAMKAPVEGEVKETDLLSALMAFDTRDCGELTRFETTQIFCHMGEKIPLGDVDKVLDGGDFWKQDRANIKGLHKWLTRPAKGIRIANDELRAFASK